MVTTTHGKGWARVGDRVSCHRNCRIASGDFTMIVDGKAVARHGDKTTCGAILISSQMFSTISEGSDSRERTASALDKPPEWSDTGRNTAIPGIQPAQFIIVEKRTLPIGPAAIPGEKPAQDPITSNTRSRPSRSDDLRSRPTRQDVTPTSSTSTDANAYSKGFMPGDAGAEEWGRRNGVGAKEGRRIFHDIKRGNRGKPGSKASDNCQVNPDTGEVTDSQGEHIGDMNDGH